MNFLLILIFRSEISIWVVRYFSLMRLSIFQYVSRAFIIISWNIFMIAALTSLFNNSNIFLTLQLAFVDCLFSFELFFLVLSMRSNFLFYLGRFDYYEALVFM